MALRVHLVDGTWELFRAHFSKRPGHTSPQGKDLKATVGVVSSMLNLIQDGAEAPTHLALAFDNPIESFRNDLFDGYKTSAGIDPELHAQFDDVEEAVAALGLTVWSMKDFEADDGLASGASLFGADPSVSQVRVLSPDKDLAQCLVAGRDVVQVNRLTNKETTRDSFQKERGFSPDSVADFLALVGDTADGIPGLDGWGEKGAATVLGQHPHLEDIPDDPSKWKVQVRGADRLAATLKNSRKEVVLYRTLATLRTDAPVSQSLDALAWKGVGKGFEAWCKKAGADRLWERAAQLGR
jgi:5'-3' exonuclease